MARLRTFGLAAHVDAGKTTLAEHILFVTGRVHVRGAIKGDRPTRLDHDQVEQNRGITVHAAATTVAWGEHELALVDTPGHVDFTVEVERALRVLDGAVLVVSAVAGVQAQTRTVERQMARYGVPRLAFLNKCDLVGADPHRAVASLRSRLGVHAALVQIPLGVGAEHRGVVDLIHRRVLTFDDDGTTVAAASVPADLVGATDAARSALLDAVTLVDAELLETVVATGDATPEQLVAAIRRATVSREFVPALVGSAARGIGVQPLLDAVVAYLPAPHERCVQATDPDTERTVSVASDANGSLVAYVFKTEVTDHGSWTWLRVHRGQLRSGMRVVDGHRRTRVRIGRLGRIDGAEVQRVESAQAGEIVAVFGLDLPSGITLCDPDARVVIGAMHVPEPVVERSVRLVRGDREQLSKGLMRLVREDPTLRVAYDAESGETRIHGMGELHLEVAAQHLEQRHECVVELGDPQVAYRLALASDAPFDFTLSKQTGGPGMYAKLVGHIAPADTFQFRWEVAGGAVDSRYRSAVEAGFRQAAANGAGGAWPMLGVSVVVTDGKTHPNDSSDDAFRMAAGRAMKQAVERAGTLVLEPVMRVVTEAPEVRPGVLASTLLARGGTLLDASETSGLSRAEADVPLARMLGFAATLRSATAGGGTFAMEPQGYAERPPS